MIKRDTLQSWDTRVVRSFVAREGRMTSAHRQILDELWSTYGLKLQPNKLDIKQIFGREAPCTLEIGFGDGRSLLQLASESPQHDFIGIEVYRTGIAKLLTGIRDRGLTNIRIFCADALEVLINCIPDSSLEQVLLFFPDPWHKARHNKRRIVQPEFAALVRSKLVINGNLHMATDWEHYAQHMLSVMEVQPGWTNTVGANQYALRPATRSLTKFEQRGHRLGHGTWDLVFRKSDNF